MKAYNNTLNSRQSKINDIRHASVDKRQISVTTLLPKLEGKEQAHNEYLNDTYAKKGNNTINVIDQRETINASPVKERSSQAQELLQYIVNEVKRFVTTKRVNEVNIRDLDQKIQMETYIREKRAAILEDRKQANEPQRTSLLNEEGDLRSNLEKVQGKYAHLAEEADARSRRSAIGGSIGAPSQVGSRAGIGLSRDRLKDFDKANGIKPEFFNTVSEKMSCVSGLQSEIDEWAALNKLQVLRQHQEAEQKKELERTRKQTLREELKK